MNCMMRIACVACPPPLTSCLACESSSSHSPGTVALESRPRSGCAPCTPRGTLCSRCGVRSEGAVLRCAAALPDACRKLPRPLLLRPLLPVPPPLAARPASDTTAAEAKAAVAPSPARASFLAPDGTSRRPRSRAIFRVSVAMIIKPPGLPRSNLRPRGVCLRTSSISRRLRRIE
jgi:hypothetical protein